MAAPRKLPDVNRLLTWREQGLTHQQMAERVYEETGQIVSRSSISAALSRAGKAAPKERYADTLPWRVRTAHLKEYPARMLRLLGRQRAGGVLSENEQTRLEHWLEMLRAGNAVVGYDPDNERQGFHYIDPKPGDGQDGIPIRRKRIHTRPVAQRS